MITSKRQVTVRPIRKKNIVICFKNKISDISSVETVDLI